MNVLFIITGSVAAYKSLEIIRELKIRKHNLQCVLSRGGEKFVTPLSVTSLSCTTTYTENDHFSESGMSHICLPRNSDFILVAPASADIMAKTAHGICDELATSILMAASVPILMAPAMNTVMWNSPAMKRNLSILKKDGVHIIEPEYGSLACGEVGIGKMAKVEDIVKYVEALCQRENS